MLKFRSFFSGLLSNQLFLHEEGAHSGIFCLKMDSCSAVAIDFASNTYMYATGLCIPRATNVNEKIIPTKLFHAFVLFCLFWSNTGYNLVVNKENLHNFRPKLMSVTVVLASLAKISRREFGFSAQMAPATLNANFCSCFVVSWGYSFGRDMKCHCRIFETRSKLTTCVNMGTFKEIAEKNM